MRIVFVADFFIEQFKGGSELSIQSHIDTCPYPYIKIQCKDFKLKAIKPDDIIVFGNFSYLDKTLLHQLAGYTYVVEECDYQYCRYRSKHRHKFNENKECDCPQTYSEPIINFYMNAQHLFWKSEGQRSEYYRIFPQLYDKPSDIMGGVFTDKQLDLILSLKDAPHDDYYFVLMSKSWIKGHSQSLQYCIKNKLKFRECRDLNYEEALRAMASCKGIVYMPQGFDVSCRMITEMKLMGREIITNNLVQHMTEPWFNSGEAAMLEFLRNRNPIFWSVINGIKATACAAQ